MRIARSVISVGDAIIICKTRSFRESELGGEVARLLSHLEDIFIWVREVCT
jgi:hypothetical protein